MTKKHLWRHRRVRSVSTGIKLLLIPKVLTIDTGMIILNLKKYHLNDNELVIMPVYGLTYQA